MPGRTWAATSAMWIQSRIPSPSARGRDRVVEVARGRRVDGEGVERGQVAALGLDPLGASAIASAASSSIAASKPRSPPAPRSAPRRRRARRFGSPISATTLARVAVALDDAPSRRRAPATPPPMPTCSAPRSNSGSATQEPAAAPDDRDEPAARLSQAATPASCSPSTASAAVESLVVVAVFGSSAARTSGFTPSPRIEVPSAVRYSPIGQVERAARRAGRSPPGRCPCRRCGCRPPRRGRSAAAPRSGSPRPRPCRG